MSNGTTLGDNFKVSDDQESSSQYEPSISINNNGNFVITWRDLRNGVWNIYAQRYSIDRVELGHNFKVNDDQGSTYRWNPSVSIGNNGNFVITWQDERNGDYDIYAQRYSNDGNAIGKNIRVNDDQGSTNQGSPAIFTDSSGNFVITWDDYHDGNYDIYAQRYLRDGTTLGENFRVTNTGDSSQFSPDVKLWKGLIYTTWVDNRAGGTGYDIWANVLDGEFPDTDTRINEEEQSAPSTFTLHQNYPNPFNPTTVIQYQLPENGFVTLEIYNHIGQRVKTLVNQNQPAGAHQQIWDGTNDMGKPVPSGVYFYQLRSGDFSATRKMLLMQ